MKTAINPLQFYWTLTLSFSLRTDTMDGHSSRNTNDGRITAHIDLIRRPLGSLMDHIRRPVEGTSTRSYLNYATVRTENNISGVLELGGRVQAVRLEEPKHIKTTASQYSGSKVVPSSVNPRDEDLSRILECPVCYAIPESEVFNCEKGHSVCGKCRVRLYQCALCASAFNGSRNFLVESLISYFKKVGFSVERAKPSVSTNSEILVSCAYKSEGCRRRLPRSESEDHTSVCEFRYYLLIYLFRNPLQISVMYEGSKWEIIIIYILNVNVANFYFYIVGQLSALLADQVPPLSVVQRRSFQTTSTTCG